MMRFVGVPPLIPAPPPTRRRLCRTSSESRVRWPSEDSRVPWDPNWKTERRRKPSLRSRPKWTSRQPRPTRRKGTRATMRFAIWVQLSLVPINISSRRGEIRFCISRTMRMLLHLLSLVLYQELPVLVGKICVLFFFLVCILSCFFESYIVCVMCCFLSLFFLLLLFFFFLLSLTSHFAFLSSLSLSLSPSMCTSWSFPLSPKPCPFVY